MVFIPSSVTANDIFAYLVGKKFGRTPLIRLSPNKTVEGFLGGAFFTFLVIYFIFVPYMHYEPFVCMHKQLFPPVYAGISCECKEALVLFTRKTFTFPIRFEASPVLIMCVICGSFVSLLAPFAGFLGSGLKRSLNLKDFSNTLPGHGGFVDRLDCLFFANIFMFSFLTSFFYKEFIILDKA